MRTNTLEFDPMNQLISISEFNKGKAGKIFLDVKEHGHKFVIKNNKAAGVIISVEEFERIREELNDFYLMLESEKRLKTNSKTYTQEEMLNELKISSTDILE